MVWNNRSKQKHIQDVKEFILGMWTKITQTSSILYICLTDKQQGGWFKVYSMNGNMQLHWGDRRALCLSHHTGKLLKVLTETPLWKERQEINDIMEIQKEQ